MKKPLVAVVGRPNVGKSTFFNKICGRRISIVEDTPGVTRDRIYADAEWCGHSFTLVDTGGLDFAGTDVFNSGILKQAQMAIDLADVIVFLSDGRDGVTQLDHEVADYLRKSKKPIVLVVNKLDNFEVELTYDFYSLGLGEPFPISCEQSKGLGEVLDAIVANFTERNLDEAEDGAIKIAIIGRPNAGKSSITNKLLGAERVLVSSVAGTTRDAIDSPFRYNGKDYIIIDTAGMRRNKSFDIGTIESYSVIRSMEAIRRADVVVIVFDASEEISEQDVRIAGYVHEEGKPSIVALNKWDIACEDDKTINKMTDVLKDKLAFMSYFKPLFISAKTGKRVSEIMPAIIEAYDNSCKKVSTSTLNGMLQEAVLANDTPSRNGRKLKIRYITQTGTKPPTFTLFCNDAKLMHFSYLRYLENRFRTVVDFSGTPIKLITKSKTDKE